MINDMDAKRALVGEIDRSIYNGGRNSDSSMKLLLWEHHSTWDSNHL